MKLSQKQQGKDTASEAIKKPNGRLPKPQRYFIWERFARTAGVLVPWRLEGEIKTRTLLSTGGRPRLSTKCPQLICGDQRRGKWGFLVLCNWKNMQRSYFLCMSQDLVTFTYENITGGSEEKRRSSVWPRFEKAQFFTLPPGRLTWGFPPPLPRPQQLPEQKRSR